MDGDDNLEEAGHTRARKLWSKEEEKILAEAWIEISQDQEMGNDKENAPPGFGLGEVACPIPNAFQAQRQSTPTVASLQDLTTCAWIHMLLLTLTHLLILFVIFLINVCIHLLYW